MKAVRTITKSIALLAMLLLTGGIAMSAEKTPSQYNPLTPEEERVILQKGTERPFTGKYEKFNEKGTYICKRCNAPLFKSGNKFDAGCGWPSFDEVITGAVKRVPDPDGRRTEIECAHCGAHLGHVFVGEGFTAKNTRHCVNSISMNFIPEGQTLPAVLPVNASLAANAPARKDDHATTETAIFAGGCFWGVEYHLGHAKGVISANSGYTGGTKENPTYKEVCTGTTGHAESVKVVFDKTKTSFEKLAKLFFEIHDPGEFNRQGPDVGEQYRSAIFYTSEEQKQTAQKLIDILKSKGYKVVTQLQPAGTFWPAEPYHQKYFERKGVNPCHIYKKKF